MHTLKQILPVFKVTFIQKQLIILGLHFCFYLLFLVNFFSVLKILYRKTVQNIPQIFICQFNYYHLVLLLVLSRWERTFCLFSIKQNILTMDTY